MAESATPDNVNKDQTNVDYGAALELIQTTIHGIESEQRSLSADAKDAWDRIEGLGVNKVGAQLFGKILKKPVEQRRDQFRTIVNLAKAAGWFDWLDDLVDRSQAGPVVSPPAKSAPKPPEAAAPPPPPPPADSRDLANAAVPERIDLKKGWVQRLKADAPEGCDLTNDDFWEDVRQATPTELAAERERIADFDVGGANDDPAPDVAEAKKEVAAKVQTRRAGGGTLKVVGGTANK